VSDLDDTTIITFSLNIFLGNDFGQMNDHKENMKLALEEARKAGEKDEVPVGCVITDEGGKLIASAHNQTITMADPTAHAEILALRQACGERKNYRLLNTYLYVTVEPCVMCMGAIIHSRVSRIIFGTYDSKWGAAGSLYDFSEDRRLNHHPEIISGICIEECRALIQKFFRNKRC